MASVAFNDLQTASDTLNALRVEPSIKLACIYSGTQLFAAYAVASADRCPTSIVFKSENALLVSTPIVVQGKHVGLVQLHATMRPMYAHLLVEIATITAFLVLTGFFALALSARLQKVVSDPILSLAKIATEVSRQRDYSLRAPKLTRDELGVLCDSFNEMLVQLELRAAEVREHTKALGSANEELQKANRMKDEFLTMLSHELRTPLTAIYGWVTLLERGHVDQRKLAHAVEVIGRNVKAQAKLVDDLLNVSQIVTGKMQIQPEWIELADVVNAAVDSVRPAAAAKGVDVVVHLQGDKVFADAGRLQQVVWNLLTNAIKFTDKGGEIKVETGLVGSKIQLSVTDTGEGIEAEFIPFLFERFTQADSSKSRRHGGLGLGLAIVRHIVEVHGGAVFAHSEGRGKGATFIVQLPVPALQMDRPARQSQPEVSLRGMKVMLVEDESDTRDVLSEALQQFGASVRCAASAAEALAQLAEELPDVLISDIGMPDVDGYELLRTIRSQALMPPTLPAVALTAFAGERDKEASFRAGYQAHFGKPVSIDDLVSTIAALKRSS
jgi:signal transduction histidine kinase/CheY-like chemotaxis protein